MSTQDRPAGRWLLAAMAGVGLLASPAMADRVTVYIYDFEFSINPPGEDVVDPVINAGDIIVWQTLHDFHDAVACVGQDEYWNSGMMNMGDTFEYFFSVPGVYNYYCSPHGSDNGDGTASGMTGKIVVRPVPAPSAGLALSLAALGAAGRRRRRSA